jgi:hypothetical protein
MSSLLSERLRELLKDKEIAEEIYGQAIAGVHNITVKEKGMFKDTMPEVTLELHYMQQHQERAYFNTCLALGYVSLMRTERTVHLGIEKEVAHLLWKPKDVTHLTGLRSIIHMHQDEIYNLINKKDVIKLRAYLAVYKLTLH